MDRDKPSEAAAKLKAANVEVYVFGVGNYVYPQELTSMASPPTCTHVRIIRQFSELVSIRDDITRRSCDASLPVPEGHSNFSCGYEQFLTITPGPEVTIKIAPTDGQVRVYASFNTSQPNSARNLFFNVASNSRPLLIYMNKTSDPLYLTLDTVGECRGSVMLDIDAESDSFHRILEVAVRPGLLVSQASL